MQRSVEQEQTQLESKLDTLVRDAKILIGGVLMSEETQTRSDCVLWVDHTNRIISSKKAEGFEAKVFPTREEKIAYAFRKGTSGYRIQ